MPSTPLTTAIYDTWLGYGSLATAAKLSCLMLLAVVLLIALERRSRQRQQVFQKSMGFEQPLRYPSGPEGRAGRALVLGPGAGGFAPPFVILLDYGVRYFALSWTPEFVRFAGNSLAISAPDRPAGHGHCPAARLLPSPRWGDSQPAAPAPRRHGLCHAGDRAGHRRAGAAHGPGFCINDLAEWFGMPGPVCSDRHPHRHRVRLSGALRRHRHRVGGEQHEQDLPSLDMAARSLGQGAGGMLRRIHLPLVRRGLFAGAMLVFIESMKELPAALLLRPFNFETLATHVYQFVSDEMLERGRSVPSSSCWWG